MTGWWRWPQPRQRAFWKDPGSLRQRSGHTNRSPALRGQPPPCPEGDPQWAVTFHGPHRPPGPGEDVTPLHRTDFLHLSSSQSMA